MSVSLVVMAAGLGSRYGGLKQIAPVDPNGHILMDYSILRRAARGIRPRGLHYQTGNARGFLRSDRAQA